MKDPKSLFPFLFASSWVGNFFLTVLAFYLAYTHEGPLGPIVFLTVAACILSGNILPIIVYWLLITWRGAELKAEGLEASVRVRDALRRSEDIMGRLDEAEGSLAKAILVTRQVPERIRESFEELLSLASRLDTLEITSFSESLAGQSASIVALGGEVESGTQLLQKLDRELKEVPKAIDNLLESARKEPKEPMDEVDASLGERLDLLFESMESIQDSMEALFSKLSELKAPEKPRARKKAVSSPSTEAVPEPASPVSGEPERAEQKSLDLDVPAHASGGSQSLARSDQVRVVAHAMVGINNKLFIRGDEPWLSWEEGIPMNLIGIGEFVWTGDDIKDAIDVSIRLNDEIEAIGGTLKLEPGKTVEVSPHFPDS